MSLEAMKNLVEEMAKGLVDLSEAVNVNAIEGEKTTVFELRVDKSEIGKVIGKQGKMAQALRTIMSAVGAKFGVRVVLEIVD